MTQRKLSVNAPFRPSPGHSPNPPATGFPPKRPVETIEPQKINRFGEAKLRSPARMLAPPPSNKAHMNNGKILINIYRLFTLLFHDFFAYLSLLIGLRKKPVFV
jgi:hypothetical protein